MTISDKDTQAQFGYIGSSQAVGSSKQIKIICDYCNNIYETTCKIYYKARATIKKDACHQCKKYKREDISMLKYGVKNPNQRPEHKETIKLANIEKFGVAAYTQTAEFKEKAGKTNLERYGHENAFSNKEIQQKHKNNILQKYGVDNVAKVNKEKIKQTNLVKYGKEKYLESDHAKNTRKQSNLAIYGVENVFSLPEIQNKIKNTNILKYGYEYPIQNKDILIKGLETKIEKYGTINANVGKTEREIKEYLNSFGFDFVENYSILHGKEIDMYSNTLKIGIEYCGLRWHNEGSPTPRKRTYHYDKYKNAKTAGVQLITIFEDEWLNKQDIVKNLLTSKLNKNTTIGARKCEIRQILDNSGLDFINKYHLLGQRKKSLLYIGLYYKNELYAVISFNKHHRNNVDIVLNRMCFKSGYNIAGGASRMVKFALPIIKNLGYNKIITWSDNRWTECHTYRNIGFILDSELGPDYSYTILKNPKSRLSKQSFKKSSVKCPKNMTEKEFATALGYYRIWDCGKKRWVLSI